MNSNQSMQLTPSDRGHGPCKGKARALGVGAVDLPRYAAKESLVAMSSQLIQEA